MKKTNQEIGAKGFKDGWNECRAWMCKEYNLKESEVIEKECFEDLESLRKDINNQMSDMDDLFNMKLD